MKTRKMIPNTLTCLNLVSGCIATLHAFQGDYTGAFVWIIMGAVFDFSTVLRHDCWAWPHPWKRA